MVLAMAPIVETSHANNLDVRKSVGRGQSSVFVSVTKDTIHNVF